MRVLLIEDHKPLCRALRQGLEEEGFAVNVANDGEEGDFKARSADYDVIILDVMIPKEDGFSLLKRWRHDGISTHVLMLTARSSIEDKVHGLDIGADDYLAKPFQLEELFARLRALKTNGRTSGRRGAGECAERRRRGCGLEEMPAGGIGIAASGHVRALV